MRRWIMAIAVLFLGAGLCWADEPGAGAKTEANAPAVQTAPAAEAAPAPEQVLKTPKEKVSYAFGMAFGRNMKAQGIDLDPDTFVKAYKDTIANAKPVMTDEEAQAAVTEFQTEIMAKKQEEMQKAGEENKKAGEAFLAENKKKEGIQTLPSGLQYKVVKDGTGKKPTANDKVTVNYKGRLLDGTEFDSSYKRNEPATFPVSGVIPGWTEAMQLMKTGSAWEIYIPAKLAYGEAGAGGVIPPNATLVFEVELLSIAPADAKAPAKSGTVKAGDKADKAGRKGKAVTSQSSKTAK
jgi:FKBP-type peptidyl-prolyl cis-trans isomerase FklB